MHERAGTPALPDDLIDVDAVLRAYHEIVPDINDATQRVSFGTSGHRGTSLNGSFNDTHIAAISLAIAEYRTHHGFTGPLFLGADTHALSAPAERTAREVLAAAGVRVLASQDSEEVPTPALSRAILAHNRKTPAASARSAAQDRATTGQGSSDSVAESVGLADGIIITPSHNPPADGGIKYNPPHGGPADTDATGWIASRANELIESGVEIPRIAAPDCDEYDFLGAYVDALGDVIDMDALKTSALRIGAHPLGGAARRYWEEIAKRYDIDIIVLGPGTDPAWSFMTLDWDGKIRMDPSSTHAMAVVDEFRGHYDLVVANDADADRFGIVTPDAGLMPPNHVLAVAIHHLLNHRDGTAWGADKSVGKTLVSSALIDRVVADHGRELLEVPVGFKWFVPGLFDGTVVFGGEESAGASFLAFDGTPWSTDKDGIVMCLLMAEFMALSGRSPSEEYRSLVAAHGDPQYSRVDAAATPDQKAKLASLTAADVTATELAGDAITQILTDAPGNGAAIGGIKVETEHAWFAARPSGTENVYKIYAESFRGAEHLDDVLKSAQQLVNRALDAQ